MYGSAFHNALSALSITDGFDGCAKLKNKGFNWPMSRKDFGQFDHHCASQNYSLRSAHAQASLTSDTADMFFFLRVGAEVWFVLLRADCEKGFIIMQPSNLTNFFEWTSTLIACEIVEHPPLALTSCKCTFRVCCFDDHQLKSFFETTEVHHK